MRRERAEPCRDITGAYFSAGRQTTPAVVAPIRRAASIAMPRGESFQFAFFARAASAAAPRSPGLTAFANNYTNM
jgi:hypothetical protein